MTPAHWVLGDSTGPTQSFTTGLRSPFGPGARHHTGSSPFINNFSSARESLPSRYFTFTRRTRASIGSLFLESWMSLFFQDFLCHISIFWLWMQEEFNCAWLQKFVQSFPSPACWHIFTQPRIFVQIRRRKIILSTLLYLFSFLYWAFFCLLPDMRENIISPLLFIFSPIYIVKGLMILKI